MDSDDVDAVVGAVDDVMDSAVDDVAACRYFCGSWWCR